MAVLILTILVREEKKTYNYELLDLRNDIVFKAFFGDERNISLLLHFLNAVLNEQITSIKLSDPHLEITHLKDKISIMDVRVETENNEQINVEIQLRHHKAFEERMLMYWTKMYGSQDIRGEEYTKLTRAIQIIISDFNMFPTKQTHRKFRLMDEVDHVVFTDHIEVHVLQLPKRKNKNIKEATDLEKWLMFLKGDRKEKEELAMESSMMKDAHQEIERLSQDPETRRLADYWDHQLRGQMQFIADAKEQGEEKRDREIVINMIKQKVAVEDIAKFTGINPQRVNEIIESIAKS